jgi:mono/diheme cytochrome c family protein
MKFTFLFALLSVIVVSCLNADYNQGKTLYTKHCSNCHGNNGEGLGQLMPPIKNADYVKLNHDKLACIIRYGLEGSITVNNKEYNMAMPPQKQLSDIELVNVINYILTDMNDMSGYKNLQDIERQLQSCGK